MAPRIHQQEKETTIEVIKAHILVVSSLMLLLGVGLWWVLSDTPVPPVEIPTQPEFSKLEAMLPERLGVGHPASIPGEPADNRPVIRLSGRVVNSRGDSLAGVNLSSSSGVGSGVITDEQGFYQTGIFVDLNPTRYELTFRIEGYRTLQMQVKLRDHNISELILNDVILEPLGTAIKLGGVIRGDSGIPIAGETVHLYSSSLDARHHAQSDEDGEFWFPEVHAATDYRLWIDSRGSHSGYNKLMFDVGDESSYLDITLAASEASHLQGRMVDTQGRGIANRTLLLESDKAPASALTVTGDADGYFSGENIPQGRLTLRSGTAPYLAIDGIESVTNTGELVELVLDMGGGMVEGRVTDSSGVPVAGAEVRMDWLQSYGSYRSRSRRFRSTDESGAFSFDNLGGGLRQISVTAPGFLAAEVELDEHNPWLEVYLQDRHL